MTVTRWVQSGVCVETLRWKGFPSELLFSENDRFMIDVDRSFFLHNDGEGGAWFGFIESRATCSQTDQNPNSGDFVQKDQTARLPNDTVMKYAATEMICHI
tara:strand:+ start:1004 stop:1306 length:303 start_codon:yes stop_codon:yes gene_type:complete